MTDSQGVHQLFILGGDLYKEPVVRLRLRLLSNLRQTRLRFKLRIVETKICLWELCDLHSPSEEASA